MLGPIPFDGFLAQLFCRCHRKPEVKPDEVVLDDGRRHRGFISVEDHSKVALATERCAEAKREQTIDLFQHTLIDSYGDDHAAVGISFFLSLSHVA